MGTEDIYHYRRVDERISTGGQPSEEQLASAAADGFEVVINLATFDPERSLPDEGASAHDHGMEYHHIPVVWDNPRDEDFSEFDRVMSESAGKRTLVHCMANYRATAFFALYSMKHAGWERAKAAEFIAATWAIGEYPAWSRFFERTALAIAASSRPRDP
jgi:uncharacterized protein (TIGR01244 family)